MKKRLTGASFIYECSDTWQDGDEDYSTINIPEDGHAAK